MAKHGWIASVALSVGAAAAAAAAQFGLGYGLGILSWAPGRGNPGTTDSAWLASLAWTTWIAATSTVLGAVLADRRSAGEIGAAPPRPVGSADGPVAPPGMFATASWRGLLAVSAAVGATLSVALVLVPAHEAVRTDTSTPQLIAAGYAIVGVVLGIVIAVCALAARSAAANVVWSAGWLWLLAIAAVIDGVIEGNGLHSVPLAVWPFGGGTYFRETWSIEGAALMLGVAFIIGAGAAWVASLRMDSRTGIALSGALGPILVAVSYFLTAPRLVGVDADQQVSAYLVAPYAVIAGLAGSVLLVAALTSREASLRRRPAPGNTPVAAPAWATVPPQRPTQPSTAEVLAGAPTSGSGSSGDGSFGGASSAAGKATGKASVVNDSETPTEDLDVAPKSDDAIDPPPRPAGAGRGSGRRGGRS